MRSQGEKREIRIAYVGGGSRNWAMRLMGDLALAPKLSGELRLYDIDLAAARHNAALGAAIFARPEARGAFVVTAMADLSEALKGADFVVISIEPGPTEARYADLEIPAKYGIPQTVGDTAGPGGLLRSLRAIPLMVEIGRAIGDNCPNAHVINYTNPMTLSVAALYSAGPSIKAHGCCHEVFAIQERAAELVAADRGLATAPRRSEIEIDIAGVNHFTLATALSWRGEDLLPLFEKRAEGLVAANAGVFPDLSGVARERKEAEKWFDCDGNISLEFLLRFGALGAAGDRHLAEFVPWFLTDEKSINYYGIPLTPYAWRIKARDSARPTFAAISATKLEHSKEEGVAQIEALLGLGDLKTNVNLPNRGQWADAPLGHIVETQALLTAGKITPIVAGRLPKAAAALEARIIGVQALVFEAALRRDRGLALEALLLDPLVRLPPAKAEAMLAEMLAHDAPWLPGWQ